MTTKTILDEIEQKFEKAWNFGVDDNQRKANVKHLLTTSLATALDQQREEMVEKIRHIGVGGSVGVETDLEKGYYGAIDDIITLLTTPE